VTDRKQHNLIMLVLGALAAIGPFSTDMYLPGFQAIAHSLRTDIAHVDLSLTSYFIGISLGQLAYGPMLDRYGRKKPIVIGLLLYIFAALGCALSPSIAYLITLRFFLAVGACVGMVGSRAVVRDLFSGSEIARALSMLMMIFGIAPIIAPTIGGLAVTLFGWRFIFGVLAAIAVVVLFAVQRLLRETKQADLSVSLRPANVVREYLNVFREREFIVYAGAASAATACLFSYITGSPFVFIDLFGFTPTQFGWIYGVNACSLIAANHVNRVLLKKYDIRRVLLVCTIVQSAIGVLLLAGSCMGFLPKMATLGLIFCFLFCFASIMPNAMGLALQRFSRNAGSASALIGAMQMIVGALASALVSYLHDGTAFPMALMMCASASTALILLATATLFSTRLSHRHEPGRPSMIE
jgi:DHA1 family bicyclomycin/chloramphenicol resistance-like MFS transporter